MASIDRVLIANRGEIAVRIARTAHRLGIDTVGVYSEPDANALHVDAVDVAVALGGSTPADSYLRGDLVIRAALDTGADAIHPGYGFLAENARFAQEVTEAGLIWVGPTPEQITLLGDKVAAKRAAIDAGVPTTSIIEVEVGEVPSNLPMPALVKAAAGGGGRGMRVVRAASELGEAIEAASREALSAFGDGTVFVEPYIEHGRHVEVQIIGDAHGNVVHLGERDCSIQRRNQKVVEESPSAGISDDTRALLCDGAVALAQSVGYQNAGTVEFLVGADATITFLEVNTRLQVEHPVTEAVTGFDLVELQLLVAAGDPLPIAQSDVRVDGHAIEVRVVAENPRAGWIPSTGRIEVFDLSPDVRVDTGFRAGSDVSSEYDSLLAKVIAHGSTRALAARRLSRALRGSQIAGVDTDLDTLEAILVEADFLSGSPTTSYLTDHPDVQDAAGPSGDDRIALLLAAVFADEQLARAADRYTAFAPSGWRNMRTQAQRQVWTCGEETCHVEVWMRGGSAAGVLYGPWPEPLEDGALSPDERRSIDVRLPARQVDRQVIEIDGRRHAVRVTVDGSTIHARSPAGAVSWTQAPRFVVHDADSEGSGPVCPLPGTVIAVHVEVGQTVGDGDVLMVVEAMKMEHKITAHSDGVVGDVRYAVGDRVDAGELLVVLDHPDSDE